MAKVLIIADTDDTEMQSQVALLQKNTGFEVKLTIGMAYIYLFDTEWDAYIVLVDSLTRMRQIVQFIQKKKGDASLASIIVWQPSILTLGAGISIVYEVEHFKTALYNVLFEKKKREKTA